MNIGDLLVLFHMNIQVVKLPKSFKNVMDKGNVVKLNRRDVQELPKIVGGVDGCQVCSVFRTQEIISCSGRLRWSSLGLEDR